MTPEVQVALAIAVVAIIYLLLLMVGKAFTNWQEEKRYDKAHKSNTDSDRERD